jgi:Protein of unknown function (DUF664)
MAMRAPRPGWEIDEPAEVFLGLLDYYRDVVLAKLDGLSETELRTSRLSSGWTPIELLKHLVYMERRWLRWGFTAEQVDMPWGDHGPDDRWQVGPDETVAGLSDQLRAGGRRTREIVAAEALTDRAAIGGRFTGDRDPAGPALSWILGHVLQEYARHAGHLDIVRELADGRIGEDS